MKNKLSEKIKAFFKGLFPNIGKEVKPVVIETLEPKKRKRIVKKVKRGTEPLKGKGKK